MAGASIPGPIPYGLGTSLGLFVPSGFAFNYAINGLPFLSAASREHPIIRITAQYRKQQFDNSREPGEQSLEGWWIRSQRSFHGGAGQLFGDPDSDGDSNTSIRFYDSVGVDIWTPGEIKLLNGVTQIHTDNLAEIIATPVGTAFGYTESGTLWYWSDGTVYTGSHPGNGSPVAIAADGGFLYVADDSDGIYRVAMFLDDNPLSQTWNLIWDAGGSFPRIAFVKERLILADDEGVYELSGTGPTLPTPKWTPGVGLWQPVGITEGGNSIYVAGNGGGRTSTILRFTLDTDGQMPTLTSGITVAELPTDESITAIFGYLGRFLAIGTDRGARIGVIGDDGSVEVGPLLFEGVTVQHWAASGEYLYCAVTDTSVSDGPRDLYRIHLGTELTHLRFAYARDIRIEEPGTYSSGFGALSPIRGIAMPPPSPLTMLDPAPVMLIATGNGVYQKADTYVSSGYLQTSRLRFGTLEPKTYKLLRVRGPVLEGPLQAQIIDDSDNSRDVVGWNTGAVPGGQDVDVPAISSQDFVSLKFILNSDNSDTTTAKMHGYQLKALPATPRQRMIQLPLLCFDVEQDRYGNVLNVAGSAAERLLALEELDKAADVVVLQDLDRGTSERVIIEQVEFRQTSPPDTPPNAGGWGGIILLTLRTV